MADLKTNDRYEQWAILKSFGAVATSGTVVTRLTTGITSLQKVAWAVSRLEYMIHKNWEAALAQTGDFIQLFVSASADTGQPVDLANASIYNLISIVSPITGAASNHLPHRVQPFTVDFAPGRELFVLPQNLFLGVSWDTYTNLSADVAYCRMYYKEVELAAADWMDLFQLRLPIGV